MSTTANRTTLLHDRQASLRQEGFTIIELLITLIVTAVVFGAFTGAYTTIQNINKKAVDTNNANTLAFSKMQEYENKSFSNIPTTTPAGSLQEVEDFSSSLPTTLSSPRVAKVYVNTVSSTLKQVVVDVKFGSGSNLRTIQYSSLIQRYGVGQ